MAAQVWSSGVPSQVTNAFASVTTCTQPTVATLRSLLGLEEKPEPANRKAAKKQKADDAAPIIARKSKQVGKQRSAAKAAVEVHEDTAVRLTPREKLILATEVVNVCLKNLGDALKAKQQATGPSKSAESKSESDRARGLIQSSNLNLDSTKQGQSAPLQQVPVSRALNRSRKDTNSQRPVSPGTSASDIESGPGVVATAECARLAFAYLRSQQTGKRVQNDMLDLQIENGTQALIGKLIAHGLGELAFKELRILKGRLLSHLNNDAAENMSERKGSLSGHGAESSSERTISATLLEFPSVNPRDPLLRLIVNHQIHVLNALSMSRRPDVVGASVIYLNSSSTCSPTHLLSGYAKQSEDKAKTAMRLEAVSRALLSLCPGSSKSQDTVACNRKIYARPETIFHLQHIALWTRICWWNISGHNPNVENEILDPFSKFLSAFLRRSDLPPLRTYQIALEFWHSLQQLLEENSHSKVSSCDSSALADIFKTLSFSAQAASIMETALHWTKEVISLQMRISASEATLSASHLRMAALALESLNSDNETRDVERLSNEALNCLRRRTKGTATELDALFEEVTGLMKVTVNLIIILNAQSSPLTKTSRPARLSLYCSIIYSCAHFLLKYLASGSRDDAAAAKRLQQEERMEKAQRVAPSYIDAVVLCSKALIETDASRYEALDAALQECCAIIANLSNTHISNNDNDAASRTYASNGPLLVKISNIYWLYSSFVKRTKGTADATYLRSLQRSTAVLQGCTLDLIEKGSVVAKLERLGYAYENAGRFSEARATFLETISALNRAGIIRIVGQAASNNSLSELFGQYGVGNALGRALTAYLNASLRLSEANEENCLFYDDENSSVEGRGALLEWQLVILVSKAINLRRGPRELHSYAQQVARTLFELYSMEDYPLRRRRVAVQVFRLAAEMDTVDHELVDISASLTTCYDQYKNDAGLKPFHSHIEASLGVYDAFRRRPPPVEQLTKSLLTWQEILEESRTPEGLKSRIDDSDLWIAQITSISEYFDMQGLEQLRVVTLSMIVKGLELQQAPNHHLRVVAYSKLGLQYLRLGYSGKAGLVLAKAKSLLEPGEVDTEAKLQWHLSYAEYLASIGNGEKSLATLSTAEAIAASGEDFAGLAAIRAAAAGRTRSIIMISDALSTHSLVEFDHGSLEKALTFAKRCVLLNQGIWGILERRVLDATQKSDSGNFLSLSGKSAVDDANAPSQHQQHSAGVPIDYSHLSGALFWCLVPSLFRSLCMLSTILSHQGLFQDALQYAQRAGKIAEALNAKHLIVRIFSIMAKYWIQSGRLENGQDCLSKASSHSAAIQPSNDLVMYHSATAQLYHEQGKWNEEREAYDRAESALRTMTGPESLSELSKVKVPEEALTNMMKGLTINPDTAPRRGRQTNRVNKPAAAKKPCKSRLAEKAKEPLNAGKAPSLAEECTTSLITQGDVLWSKAASLLSQGDLAGASDLLEQVEVQIGRPSGRIQRQILMSQRLALQGLREMAADFTYNVLPESTISFPAITPSEVNDQELSSTGHSESRALATQTIARSPQRKGKQKRNAAREDFISILRQARNGLFEVQPIALQFCSTHQISQLCTSLSRITILLSATSAPSRATFQPLYTSFSMEIPKALAFQRERYAIQADKLKFVREDLARWPASINEDDQRSQFTASEFQNEFIDIIPGSWSTISISLSDTHDELYLTRFYPGQSPFIVRLPLARHNSRDVDEEAFSLAEGKAELCDIIEKSNSTLHGTYDLTVKGAKTAWWSERESLDSRLHGLLLNIENIWLGGFRGIFSQHTRQPGLLARFQKSFVIMLNRHLPSRRGTRGQQKRVDFDPRILELFIGLGDPDCEGVDLDEPLADLLYFVVDVLQFNGERNAYDEVDFDSMTIETLDALRCYHAATAGCDTTSKHTILILDKRLHAFPWESLPCLSGVSVSRLPSLMALRSRILEAKNSHKHRTIQTGSEGHYISKENGTVILNPAGDLCHTQKVFEPVTTTLSAGWTHINGTRPSEAQFSNALTSGELFLFFGHGSGAQYVSQRTVKRLDKCAVSWLMGCSSGAVTENGEYEPDGTVLSYLIAGAPAVVAMLWDVTDKDCDRFALKCGDEWGLWDAGASSTEAPKLAKRSAKKGKERARAHQSHRSNEEELKVNSDAVKGTASRTGSAEGGPRVQKSLVEAVARSRDACYLRYLNGAAPVVYGIPVFIAEA